VIYLVFRNRTRVEWQWEGLESWNLYRGDLAVLLETGVYTQPLESGPLVDRRCALAEPSAPDTVAPGQGQVAFYLVSGAAPGGETDLGSDSSGAPRLNLTPCTTE